MTVISFLSEKGGSGKTTYAINIAREFQKRYKQTILIDSDTQESARDWNAAGGGDLLPVIGIDRPTIQRDIQIFKKQYQWIFIDGAPRIESMLVATIKCSDIILIPVQPSPYDVHAAKDLVDIIRERQSITNGQPRAAFLISRQMANTILGKEIRQVLSDYKLPVFKNGTFDRQVYKLSAAIGSTVVDANPHNPAAEEIQSIADELLEFINASNAQEVNELSNRETI